MTITEFLLARIAEDEAAVEPGISGVALHGWHTVDCGTGIGYWANGECVCGYPARVLAECHAKRNIVVDYQDATELASSAASDIDRNRYRAQRDVLAVALGHLAIAYADHPDYARVNRAISLHISALVKVKKNVEDPPKAES